MSNVYKELRETWRQVAVSVLVCYPYSPYSIRIVRIVWSGVLSARTPDRSWDPAGCLLAKAAKYFNHLNNSNIALVPNFTASARIKVRSKQLGILSNSFDTHPSPLSVSHCISLATYWIFFNFLLETTHSSQKHPFLKQKVFQENWDSLFLFILKDFSGVQWSSAKPSTQVFMRLVCGVGWAHWPWFWVLP